jgi:protein gp37
MAQDSKIEWTNHTANLWHGCTKVTAGCDHCYAETLSKRWGHDIWGNDKPRKAIRSVWKDLERYQKLAAEAGEMQRVFVGSMMDIFEKPMPLVDSKGNKIELDDPGSEMYTGDLRDTFFGNISRGEYNNLQFLLLTKRPSNINKYIPESWKENPPDNVMFGTSPCDQETFDKLVPQLYQVNGKRFLSIEPQLAEIDITKELPTGKGQVAYGLLMDWIICGGESGHGKRPFNPDWGRKIMNDCKITNVPFFMKQIDKVQPIPDDLLIRQFPKA